LSYLIDTNVISELRKGARCNVNVSAWFTSVSAVDVFLSVLTVGEIRRGIESIRRRDTSSAHALENWLAKLLANHSPRILPVTTAVAEEWGRFNVPNPLPVIDSLLAATAKVHGLTLVTRNVADVEATGIPLVNPFEPK
jgi:predicted nucleic acid-binding protein